MSDAKEWKTVKIEAPVRDDAQADPRTYSEIMRAGLDETPVDTGEIDAAALVALEDRVDEVAGMLEKIQNDWEYLNGEEIHGGVHESEHELREALEQLDQLDRIEDAAREATNAAQNAERAAEELAGQR